MQEHIGDAAETGSLDRAAESAADGDSAVESGDGDTSVATADSGGAPAFRHPGVLASRGQLDFVKAKIAAGQQPWKGDFAKASRYGRLLYTPRPVEVMSASARGKVAMNTGAPFCRTSAGV